MAKLPGIVQQPLGEFRKGNIPVPDAMASARAISRGIDVMTDLITVSSIDEATGQGAKELSELRAILVNNNTLDADWVGDDALAELHMTVSDGVGGRREVSKPRIFTHEVAAEIWDKRSSEILEHYAGQIANAGARAKWMGEMTQRYLAPGTQAVVASSAIRSRAFGQAQAERAIEGVLASAAATEDKESQAREVIARQIILGADPIWAENQLASLGPRIDQIDVQNQIFQTRTTDQIDLVEEEMWVSDNRMSPEQMRTMSSQMDARRRDFEKELKDRQTANADEMFGAYVDPMAPLTEMDVANAVTNDDISREAGWTFLNGMRKGSTTRASDPFTLSRIRGAIQSMQYTGNQARMIDRAKLLRATITRGAMGLAPNGAATGQPATITGEDVFKLNKDIDTALNAALENDQYDNALKQVYQFTGVKVDLAGQITGSFMGSQHVVDAAIAFKQGLDNYMNTFGADAKPIDYFNTNKAAYDPNLFTNGVNARFVESVPDSRVYMSTDGDGTFTFLPQQQEIFIQSLVARRATIGEPEFNRIRTLFNQFYRGQGIPPDNGRLMLEPDDPLYRQFEAMLPQ